MNDCSLRIFLSNNVWADFAEFILMFAYFLLVKLLCLLGVDTVLSACYGMVVVQEFRATCYFQPPMTGPTEHVNFKVHEVVA
jgi:hypothetical protein